MSPYQIPHVLLNITCRYYADINVHRPVDYWNYDNFTINWGNYEDYKVIRKIGTGRYGDVYLGAINNTKCVIKHLKPIGKRKINREIKILLNLRGGENIIQIIDVIQNPNSKIPSIVFDYINNTDYKVLKSIMTETDIRFYIFELLKALHYSHSNGIMHRDIKPDNVMIDHNTRQLRLIDWGIAEFYYPGKDEDDRKYFVDVASGHYRSPELLLGYEKYDYSLDMWSLGCMLAGLW
eukprot:gene5969-12041_t